MKQKIVVNIGRLAGILPAGKERLCGKEMAQMETLENAWMLIEDGRIKDFGGASEAHKAPLSAPEGATNVSMLDTNEAPSGAVGGASGTPTIIDAKGGTVMPSFCDSHTHIVYAGSREQEFVDKINGLSYAEIARRGGGILNSADRLHELSEDELYQQAMRRVNEIVRKGTGTVEIKSGYGLTTDDELKMLRVIRRIKQTAPLRVKSTFLGAHAVGRAFTGRQSAYVDLVVNEMIPEVGRQQLADFVDVFCDEGFFTVDETARILEAAAQWGMRPKIHGQELADSGGVEVAVRHNALSVDHLESMTERDIELFKQSQTMPTALPGTSFFLNMPFALGRKMIDAGLAMAIASDYNPGSTPSGDMKFVVSLACIKMRLQPAEALNAATINSAAAMDESRDYGSITRGKVANFYITEPIPSLDFIPYAYTSPIISRVFLKGEEVEG